MRSTILKQNKHEVIRFVTIKCSLSVPGLKHINIFFLVIVTRLFILSAHQILFLSYCFVLFGILKINAPLHVSRCGKWYVCHSELYSFLCTTNADKTHH